MCHNRLSFLHNFLPLTFAMLASITSAGSVFFVTTSAMHEARGKHGATLLPNGKVLVTGGFGAATAYLSSCELYDPFARSWDYTEPMSEPRGNHTSTMLPNGKVLIAGGYWTNVCSSCMLYDYVTGTWAPTSPVKHSRTFHTATLLPNGKVLVVGGYSHTGVFTASAELYDPSTGTWTETGSLNNSRAHHTATLLPNGLVLAAGGVDNNFGNNLRSAELYDPSNGTWVRTGNMISNRSYHAATLLPNGRVLIAGGANGMVTGSSLSTTELYNPTDGTWSLTGPMNSLRFTTTTTLLTNGKVLITGGLDMNQTAYNAELYDPDTGAWAPMGPMTTPRQAHSATPLANGRVLIAGGADRSHWTRKAELFDLNWLIVLVTFDTRGGTLDPENKAVPFEGEYGVLPEPTRVGYTFTGWMASTNGVFFGVTSNTVVSIPNNHTLTASWAANTYTVTFDPQGGSVDPAYKTVSFGAAYGTLPLPFLPTPIRVDYNFDGWFTDVNGSGVKITNETIVTQSSDHTLYAKWTAGPYVCDPVADSRLASAGQYTGYFYSETPFAGTDAPSIRGTITFNLISTNGNFTAKVQLQSEQICFSATSWDSHDADGTCRVTLATRDGNMLDLHVRQNRIWGTYASGSLEGENLVLDGSRNRFARHLDLEAQAILDTHRGYYTVALQSFSSAPTGAAQIVPKGSGFLTLTVGCSGKVRIAGQLADGTSFSQCSTLILFDGCGGDVCVPFFVPLYYRQGWASGLLWFTHTGKSVVTTDRDLGWFVRWEKPSIKPDGASLLLDTVGGYYSSIPSLAEHYLFSVETNTVPYYYPGGTADVQNEALPAGIDVTVNGDSLAISRGSHPVFTGSAYDYRSDNSAMATLFFTPKTGIFKGNFNLYYDYAFSGRLQHKTVRVSYTGILSLLRGADFADEPAGQGYYLVPDNNPLWRASRLKQSYRVTLDAVP